MKQKIGTMKSSTEPLSDLDVLFVAVYNLLYEKVQEEPGKGIVVSKGNPNQRRVKWSKVLSIAHEMEDFFILRKSRTGNDICGECMHWRPISSASPYIGECTKHHKTYIHRFSSCKKGFEQVNHES